VTIAYREYDPCAHYRGVAALWSAVFGDAWPVTHRVLWPRIAGRNTLEPGDGWVVLDNARIVGFGLAEIDRAAQPPVPHACVQALLVDPEYERRGIGSELLARLERRAVSLGYHEMMPGAGPWRFWTGVPDALPGAQAFFVRHGYARNYDAVDLYGSLADYAADAASPECLRRLDITVAPVSDTALGAAYDLLSRELPGWRRALLMLLEAGDRENVLLFSRGAESVGYVQLYTPQSRFRGANLVWEGRYGGSLGGFGAVLIAKAWRGKGLGAALCHTAATRLKAGGAAGCYIDWTSAALAAQLYSKVGASICARFGMYSRKLADSP